MKRGMLAGSVLVACALVGCGSGAADDEQVVGPSPVIEPEEVWDDVPFGIVEGTLTMESDCLLVDGNVVFWPLGASWDEDAQVVTFADSPSRAAPVGERFKGGGGHYDVETDFAELLGTDAGHAVDQCLKHTGAVGAVAAYPSSQSDMVSYVVRPGTCAVLDSFSELVRSDVPGQATPREAVRARPGFVLAGTARLVVYTPEPGPGGVGVAALDEADRVIRTYEVVRGVENDFHAIGYQGCSSTPS